MAMAEDLCSFFPKKIQDGSAAKTPSRSPSVVRMVVFFFFTMVCGLYICSICLKQFSARNNKTGYFDLDLPEKPSCPDLKSPLVHYPKPLTYSRAECECNPVRYFAILSMQRSGSGWFETLLNNHTNISSNGEIFSVKVRRSNASTIVETLDKVYDLDWFSSASKNDCTAAVGFKWMLNQGLMQHHEEIAKYFDRRGVTGIFLFRRNLLRRMISVIANSYDRSIKILNGTHKSHVHSPIEAKILAKYKPTVNATLLIPDLKQVEETTAKALEFFKSTRHIVVYYEDIVKNRTKINDVLEFLKVPEMELKSRQVKIHQGSLSEMVQNWEDVQNALTGTPYENFLYADYRRRL